MKKFLYFFGIILISLVIVLFLNKNNTKNVTFNGNSVGDKSKYVMEYSVLNKEECHYLELEKNEEIEVNVVSESGSVSIKIQKDNDEPIYKGTDIPTSSFVVKANNFGRYNITVIGEKSKGSVSFTKK